MGMSIDESIENIVLIKKLEDSLGNISGNTNSVASQSLGCAIDTMRKYQKIQKILNSASYVENGTVYSYTYDEDSRIKHIREVIEDGKID